MLRCVSRAERSHDRGQRAFLALGRLRAGASPAEAQAELETRIEGRTAELATANTLLQKEVAGHQRAMLA